MAIPNTVGAVDLLSYIPGEIAFDGPQRALSAMIHSDTETDNVFGRAFTYRDKFIETVRAGGTGFFAGVMIVPKAYMLDVQYARNFTSGEFIHEGEVAVELDAASTDFVIGAPVWFLQSNGSIGCGDAPSGSTAIPGAYVSRHSVSPASDGTPRLGVIYLPGLANLPQSEPTPPAGD